MLKVNGICLRSAVKFLRFVPWGTWHFGLDRWRRGLCFDRSHSDVLIFGIRNDINQLFIPQRKRLWKLNHSVLCFMNWKFTFFFRGDGLMLLIPDWPSRNRNEDQKVCGICTVCHVKFYEHSTTWFKHQSVQFLKFKWWFTFEKCLSAKVTSLHPHKRNLKHFQFKMSASKCLLSTVQRL